MLYPTYGGGGGTGCRDSAKPLDYDVRRKDCERVRFVSEADFGAREFYGRSHAGFGIHFRREAVRHRNRKGAVHTLSVRVLKRALCRGRCVLAVYLCVSTLVLLVNFVADDVPTRV